MARFVIYERITAKELKDYTEQTIHGIAEWFEQNPKRRVCNVEWVYGETFKVRKNFIKEDVESMAAQTETK